jgi:predicted GIY-YIG superfamily endonuclease
MPSKQTLLFPDPRPLVERLGNDFFRSLPEGPGVYLMHDARETVLYVGKAKNLRKRLNSYRVANPERLKRRHLRLLRAVTQIELEECTDELVALNRETALIRELKPPFNRVGVWPAAPRFIGWRISGRGLELALLNQREPDWDSTLQLEGGANHVYASLARVLWLGFHPARPVSELPAGWSAGLVAPRVMLPCERGIATEVAHRLEECFHGCLELLSGWMERRVVRAPFDRAVLDLELEGLRRRFPASVIPAALDR